MNFKPTVMKGMWSFILTGILYMLVNLFSFMPPIFHNLFTVCKLDAMTNRCVFIFAGTWLGFYILLSLFHSKRKPLKDNRLKR
ncbi:MAG TPA: hypothetical protein PKW70_04225 [Candidatus Pacearchaeota archaeon]|nr:hypothetical protein [Candidatus Pacearchaeota archaeon]